MGDPIQASHWDNHSQQWGKVEAPLRPTQQVVSKLCEGLTSQINPVLVLGVTPELTGALIKVVAVDRSISMIKRLWPGNSPNKRVVCADWLEMKFEDEVFSGAIGDGCLTVLGGPQQAQAFFNNLKMVLSNGTPFRLRAFLRPDNPWTLDELRYTCQDPGDINFHAFKWMLAMHKASQNHDLVSVSSLLDDFNHYWPDRKVLAAKTGWDLTSIKTIDAYHGSEDIYWFPTSSAITELASKTFNKVRLEALGGYPLSMQCPILTMER